MRTPVAALFVSSGSTHSCWVFKDNDGITNLGGIILLGVFKLPSSVSLSDDSDPSDDFSVSWSLTCVDVFSLGLLLSLFKFNFKIFN